MQPHPTSTPLEKRDPLLRNRNEAGTVIKSKVEPPEALSILGEATWNAVFALQTAHAYPTSTHSTMTHSLFTLQCCVGLPHAHQPSSTHWDTFFSEMSMKGSSSSHFMVLGSVMK